MKAFKKIISSVLSTIMLGSTLLFNLPQDKGVTAQTPTLVETTQTNAVTPKKYIVDVNHLGGVGASFICNNVALAQGESMTLTYTVQAKTVTNNNTTTDQRFAGVFAKSTLSKAYPVVGGNAENVTAFASFQLNGAGLDRTNAPTLPDEHFGVGNSYQLSLTPQSGNATYNWTLTKNGSQISAGQVAYDTYMGVMIYHYQNYEMRLADVSATTSNADLGVFVYNGGSGTHNASIIDGEKVPSVTLTQDSVEVSGATASVSEKDFYGNNSMCLTAGNPKMYLYIDGLDQYKTNTRVHVSLRLYLEIATTTATTSWYSPIELKKESGLYVDGDMPRNTWNHINYDTVVMERNGRKCVQLSVTANAGEVMYISTPTVSNDQTEKKYTLGGCQVYQMEFVSNLLQSYVIISPTGEVVVIDGGHASDAPVLYHFITKFTHRVDHWFISHYREDHCEALTTILQSGEYDIVIENLHYNFPTQAQCQAGFDYIKANYSGTVTDETSGMVQRKNILDNKSNFKVLNRVTSAMGQVFDLGGGSRMKVISNPDFEPNMNYGNNTSLMYKLETSEENVLFLNDIGDTGDEYITSNPTINYNGLPSATFREEIADCAYVQLGHHGQNGPSLNFYNYCTDMRICLYAAQAWVMNNVDGSKGGGVNSHETLVTLATRDFMREKGIYKYYSQENGRVKLV